MESNQSSPGQFKRVVGQLRELAAKAAPTPWVNDGKSLRSLAAHATDDIVDYVYDLEDAELIVAAVNALPALLAVADAAGDVIESRYHPQYDMTEKLDAMECATIDLRTALSLLPNTAIGGSDPPQQCENPC